MTLGRLWLNSAPNEFSVINDSTPTMGTFVFKKLSVP